MPSETQISEVRSVRRVCRGPLTKKARAAVSALLKSGLNAEAAKLDAAQRKPCGADFNALILKGKLDGQLHKVSCPRCGTSIEYRAPDYRKPEAADSKT